MQLNPFWAARQRREQSIDAALAEDFAEIRQQIAVTVNGRPVVGSVGTLDYEMPHLPDEPNHYIMPARPPKPPG